MATESEPLLITVKQAAELLSLVPHSVYLKLDKGEIQSVYQGRRRYVVVKSLKAYVANLPTHSPDAA